MRKGILTMPWWYRPSWYLHFTFGFSSNSWMVTQQTHNARRFKPLECQSYMVLGHFTYRILEVLLAQRLDNMLTTQVKRTQNGDYLNYITWKGKGKNKWHNCSFEVYVRDKKHMQCINYTVYTCPQVPLQSAESTEKYLLICQKAKVLLTW